MAHVSRAQWVVWSTALLLTGATALVIVDSVLNVSRAKPAVATPVTADQTAQLRTEADRRLAAGDYRGALEAYDEVLAVDGSDVGVYYRAGVALSHLGEREQAASVFLRVVRQGPAEREEVRRAHEWLQAAGVPSPLKD